MFLRELKVNLKSAIIWLSILGGLFFIVMLLYPYIIDGDSVSMMKEMMTLFPEELLKAFNMDIALIDTSFGWLKSEGFVLILLAVCCYASILGSSIILKEESDKTIEYLVSLPVSRVHIVVSKALAGLVYVILLVLLIGVINLVGLLIGGAFDVMQYLLLSITPLFPAISIYFISMFISTFTSKTKKMLGISIGIVFISYLIQVISMMSKAVEWLKYLSIFTLADVRNVISNTSINPLCIIVSIMLSIISFILVCVRFRNKELV